MKKLFLWISIFYGISSFGQIDDKISYLPNDIWVLKDKKFLPKNIKRIEQYEGNTLLNIREYDTSQNLVFYYYRQKWGENDYITMISGKIYTKNGELEKVYHLHSNVGMSITYYTYKNGKISTVYTKEKNKNGFLSTEEATEEIEDTQDVVSTDVVEAEDVNTNKYKYIAQIKNLKKLLENPKIKAFEKNTPSSLTTKMEYDKEGNTIKEEYYSNQKIVSQTSYKYNKNNQCIHYKNQNEMFYNNEMYFMYDRSDIFNNEKESNLLQTVKIYNKHKISETNFYQYDDENQLIETTEYDDGKFIIKYVYAYDEKGRISNQKTYNEEHQLTSETNYFYNQENNLIKEALKNHQYKESKTRTYNYKYLYY